MPLRSGFSIPRLRSAEGFAPNPPEGDRGIARKINRRFGRGRGRRRVLSEHFDDVRTTDVAH
jgi:hypothetical protein